MDDEELSRRTYPKGAAGAGAATGRLDPTGAASWANARRAPTSVVTVASTLERERGRCRVRSATEPSESVRPW